MVQRTNETSVPVIIIITYEGQTVSLGVVEVGAAIKSTLILRFIQNTNRRSPSQKQLPYLSENSYIEEYIRVKKMKIIKFNSELTSTLTTT